MSAPDATARGASGVLPFDVGAEEAVLASLMVADSAIEAVRGIVRPEDFYRETCRWTYEACLALSERAEAINQVTVAHELSCQRISTNGRNRLEEAGGVGFLSRIVGELPTPIGVEHYAAIVSRDATYRQLIGASSQITQLAYQGGLDLEAVLDRATRLIEPLREQVVKPRVTFAAQGVEEFLGEEIAEADAYIGDGGGGAVLSPGEKLMVAGPPGVGKTNIGYNMAACLTAGSLVLGLPCRRPCRVLYALLEGNRKRQQKRLRKVLLGADPETLGRFHFSRLNGLDLSQEEQVEALEELCRSLKIEVLFIDPFREAHPWGEDKSEDAARIMRVLNGLLAALPGLAIVLIHHVRKPDLRRLSRAEQTLDQIRGSGHLVAACQSVLLINEDPNEPDKLLADWVKHRDAEQRLAPMFLYFDRATLDYEVAERPGTVKVAPEAIVTAILSSGGYLKGPALVAGLVEGAGASERTVRDAIRKARDLNLITEEKVPGSNTKAYRVSVEEEEA